jgi:formamidopyrimidine-DNA glycosylase
LPELPEVETIRGQLEPLLRGRRVIESGSHPSPKFAPGRLIEGTSFTSVGRRAKFLLFGIDDGRELVAHLGMTGSFRLSEEPPDPSASHLRAWWRLAATTTKPSESLLFHDVRRFGRLRVVPAQDYSSIPTLFNAGPEPFDPALDGHRFWELLQASRRKLKTRLLSQRPIAGVGNIYADEALWQAEINPATTRISQARATLLLAALREVLAQGIAHGGTTLRDYRTVEGETGANQSRLAVYGRGGLPCLRCTTTLRSRVLDGRTTTWCPSCQHR